jgi:hypothetical protein
VKPNTRPSLRSGLTAYAVLSREPSSFWPPSLREDLRKPARLSRASTSARELDRSDDGQDHTVLSYARPACSPHYPPTLSTLPEKCWRDEPDRAARRHEVLGSRRAIRPALDLSRPTLLRPPQARLAKHDDRRSPLLGEPGWATHTIFPKFGKVEYFCRAGLTKERTREACPNRILLRSWRRPGRHDR